MKRKEFLKKVTASGLTLSFLGGINCSIISDPKTTKCDETPEGEEGPFPTHEPTKFITKNIVSDRVGIPLSIQLEIYNINDKCKVLKNATVDIWHCDHQGEYSEYGGNSFGAPPPNGKMPPPPRDRKNMPPPPPRGDHKEGDRPPPPFGGMQADHTNEHFLRGRQITDINGLVTFQSVYPGWYGGRAPHIHAHIFDEKGNSLLITQIAFPEDVNTAVYTQGVYAKRGKADTTNADDHVFNGSIANELAVLKGDIKEGYILTHSIYVKA
jgi:protocatechuate 3,4-dioxygenase beta subunit